MRKSILINCLFFILLEISISAFAQDYVCSYQAGCTYFKVFDTDAKKGYTVQQGTVVSSETGAVVSLKYGWVVSPAVSQSTITLAVKTSVP
jgi:hypothetical protein